MSCSACKISLCIHCYTIFHTHKCEKLMREAVEHVVEELDQCKATRVKIENEKEKEKAKS